MLLLTETIKTPTFPSARLPSHSGGLPVEVSVIAQLIHGSGDQLFTSATLRQKVHKEFVDELDEPSTKLGGADFSKGDATSLYTFAVGAKGHPFHSHAGHRVFTAISGSGGAQLRFSTASLQQIQDDPENFVRALHYINIPPDCLFTVRFGGGTWHQFAPLKKNSLHPAFFAISCHTNELGGELPDSIKEKVLSNKATIPALTELLPKNVVDFLQKYSFKENLVPTIDLSIEAPPGTLQRVLCDGARSIAGWARRTWTTLWGAKAFFTQGQRVRQGESGLNLFEDSLLNQQFPDGEFHYQDKVCFSLDSDKVKTLDAKKLLADLLEGFLVNRPKGVTRWMLFRNFLVKPLGLRTSPLGCPVSSLLSEEKTLLFANGYPVFAHRTNEQNSQSHVILGANDKHLLFRSCVGVEILHNGHIKFSLATGVKCKNAFGHFYMAVINRIHRSYIAPTMLHYAVDHVMKTQ